MSQKRTRHFSVGKCRIIFELFLVPGAIILNIIFLHIIIQYRYKSCGEHQPPYTIWGGVKRGTRVFYPGSSIQHGNNGFLFTALFSKIELMSSNIVPSLFSITLLSLYFSSLFHESSHRSRVPCFNSYVSDRYGYMKTK